MTGTKKGDSPEMADKEKETEKPLDKMTAIKLRELAKAIPDITGVHGMKKAELLAAVKEARGIKEAVTQKAVVKEDKGIKEAVTQEAAVKEAKGIKEEVTQEAAVKEARGIKEEVTPKADKTVGGIKKKIKALKAARQAALEAKDKKMAKIYRRRISRLKKQTRKAA
jgi:nitrate reductase alpha subunit